MQKLEREKLLQLVLDNIPSYVWWKDTEGVFLGCNTKLALSAGLNSPNEIIGKTDYDLPWNREDSDYYRKIDQEVMDTKIPQINFEESQTIDNQSTRWLRTSKIPLLNEKGVVIGTLGTYEDITERKQIELELVKRNKSLKALNEKLEMINVDLEQFTYATSHDLQEPLRMIGGFASLIDRRYAAKLDKEGIQYLKFIQEGTIRMSNQIRQILSYSKIEKIEEANKEADITFLLEEVLKDLNALITDKKAVINIDITNPNIVCQPYRIKMLLYNLINNGIKFNTSKVPTITIKDELRESEWYFTVSDNGIGIDEEYKDYIFKPFKRLNTLDKFPGNGIGLSICYRIAHLHGGEIWLTSQKKEGSTFHFTIKH